LQEPFPVLLRLVIKKFENILLIRQKMDDLGMIIKKKKGEMQLDISPLFVYRFQ